MVSKGPSSSVTLILDLSGTLNQGRERKTGWTLQVRATNTPWATGRVFPSELEHHPFPSPLIMTPQWQLGLGMGDYEYQLLCWIGQLLAEKVKITLLTNPSPVPRVWPPGPSKSLRIKRDAERSLSKASELTH